MRRILIGCAVMLASSASAQTQVAGRVTDAARRPLQGVEVLFVAEDSVYAAARTDSAGTFGLREVRWGSSLRLRRLGYRPRSVPIDPGSELQIVLQTMPADLEAIHVIGQIDASKGRLAEFYAHREKAQFGFFFDREQVERDRPQTASELMRRVPGARLMPTNRFGYAIRLRGCQPLVWLDGIRMPGAELDDMVNVHDIDAIEVYPSAAGVPANFTDRRNNCGTIIVWSRAH
jgi:hypothetical protein